MNTAEYCVALAAPEGSGLYYALLYHTPAERRAVTACFAFLDAVRGIALPLSDTTPMLRRLAWWQEELAPGHGAASPHPVVAELCLLVASPAELERTLAPCIGAMRRELSGWQPQTADEWFTHCREAAAGAWQLAARHCGAGDDILADIGCLAARHTQLLQLQDLARRLASGRCDLPRDLLARCGWIPAIPAATRPAAGAGAAIRAGAGLLRAGFAEFASVPERYHRLPRFCRVLARIDTGLCTKILHRPGRLLAERVALSPLHKLWHAWRERN